MSLSVLRAAAEAPDRPGLIYHGHGHGHGRGPGIEAGPGRILSFAELAGATRAAMDWLQRRGVREGARDHRVALRARADLPELLILYALFELGVPPVLLHPRLTARERGALVADSKPTLVIDEGDAARLASDEGALPAPVLPGLAREPHGPPAPPADDGRPLAILYTSGSTARPKGVVLSRAAFVASAAASAANLGWRADDRWLLCMPIAHVGGLSIVTRCLLARRPLVLRPASSFEPATLAAALVADRVTLVSLVPTMLQRLLALPASSFPAPSLRAVLLGGAAAPPSLLREAAARGVPVLTTYGLTEACSQVTAQRHGTAPDPAQGAGAPLPGVALRIVSGQVQVRGPMLLSGYLHGDGVAVGDDGFFATGDLGFLDPEGRLHIRGRASELIISGGENVSPQEVEPVLLSCPGVAAACVFGVADPLWGQLVAAALVPGDPAPSAEQLRASFVQALAPHRRPRRVAFLPELPLLANGKVDRAAVQRLALPLLQPV